MHQMFGYHFVLEFQQSISYYAFRCVDHRPIIRRPTTPEQNQKQRKLNSMPVSISVFPAESLAMLCFHFQFPPQGVYILIFFSVPQPVLECPKISVVSVLEFKLFISFCSQILLNRHFIFSCANQNQQRNLLSPATTLFIAWQIFFIQVELRHDYLMDNLFHCLKKTQKNIIKASSKMILLCFMLTILIHLEGRFTC